MKESGGGDDKSGKISMKEQEGGWSGLGMWCSKGRSSVWEGGRLELEYKGGGREEGLREDGWTGWGMISEKGLSGGGSVRPSDIEAYGHTSTPHTSTTITQYSRIPLIRPPSKSHWCGRIRGMVAREGFRYAALLQQCHTKYGRIRGMVVGEGGRSTGVLLYC